MVGAALGGAGLQAGSRPEAPGEEPARRGGYGGRHSPSWDSHSVRAQPGGPCGATMLSEAQLRLPQSEVPKRSQVMLPRHSSLELSPQGGETGQDDRPTAGSVVFPAERARGGALCPGRGARGRERIWVASPSGSCKVTATDPNPWLTPCLPGWGRSPASGSGPAGGRCLLSAALR